MAHLDRCTFSFIARGGRRVSSFSPFMTKAAAASSSPFWTYLCPASRREGGEIDITRDREQINRERERDKRKREPFGKSFGEEVVENGGRVDFG